MIRSNDVEDFLVSFVEERRLESRHYYANVGVLFSRLHIETVSCILVYYSAIGALLNLGYRLQQYILLIMVKV